MTALADALKREERYRRMEAAEERHKKRFVNATQNTSSLYLKAPRLVKDFAHVSEKTNLDKRADPVPGAGWKSSRGAAPGTRKPRAGYYQNAKHEAVAAGIEADSDEDDDATELPPWNAMLRTERQEGPKKKRSPPPPPHDPERMARAEEKHAARVSAAPPRHDVDYAIAREKKIDVGTPVGPVRAVAWGAPPPPSRSRSRSTTTTSTSASTTTTTSSSDESAAAAAAAARAERAEEKHRTRVGAGPPRVEVDWAVRSKPVDVSAPRRTAMKGGGAVRWGSGPARSPSPSTTTATTDAASTATATATATAAEARSARAAEAEAAAVARMRLTEPRLSFDHCVVQAKSDLYAPRVRSRGEGPPPPVTRAESSGRPRQIVTELVHLASRHEAAGRVKDARDCLLRCVETLRQSVGHEHPELGRAVRLLANLTHSQFGKTKSGEREAAALYQWSADIAVSAYGYEHPVTVEALNALEEMRRVKHRPPPRPETATHSGGDVNNTRPVMRAVRAVRWKHPEPERMDVALKKYGYGYDGSVAKSRRNGGGGGGGGGDATVGGGGGGGRNPAEIAAKLHQHFVKTVIF